MDQINWLLLASRWLHITAAVVAIGGAAFSTFALLPAMGEALDAPLRDKLREAVRKRWAWFVRVCIAVLIASGSFNFAVLVLPRELASTPYHPIFGVKVLAALFVFTIACVLTGTGRRFAKVRQAGGKWLAILLALAGVIFLLSAMLSQIRAAQGRPLSPEPTPQATQAE